MPARAAALCFLLATAGAGALAGTEIRITPAPVGIPGLVTVPAESSDAALAHVQRALADAGFIWPTVGVEASGDGTDSITRYLVQPGPSAKIGGWFFTGAESVDRDRLADALPRRGERFTASALKQAMEEVAAFYARAGFPLATVGATSVRESIPCVSPVFSVIEGPRVFVRYLDFAGRALPGPVLLLRAARFRAVGYTPAHVSAWRRQLDRSGLVSTDSEALTATARVPSSRADSGESVEYGVRFWLTALKVNRASAAVGWSPDDHKLTGFADLVLGNLFSTGRRFAAAWRSGYGRLAYSAGYTEPRLFNTNFDVSLSARQDAQDSAYSRIDLAIKALYAAAGGVDVSSSSGFERDVDIAAAADAQTLWVGTGVEMDTRDYQANPRRGLRIVAATRAGQRSADSAAQFVSSTELDFVAFLPAGRAMSLSGRLGARAMFSQSGLLPSELYGLGGTGTVRGYSDEQFRSRLLGWVSVEPAVYFGRSSRAYPFFDAGMLTEDTGWRVVSGYGAGVRVATRAGAVGFDYGVAFGDNPLSGKVHISYEAEF